MLGKLSDRETRQLLESHHIGRIGCCNNNMPYVVPVNYAYENGIIYCHSGDGMKIRLMRNNPNICFQVDNIQDMLNWKSVIALGKFEEITEMVEKETVLQKLIDKISPYLKDSDSHPSHGITAADSDIGNGVELVLYKLVLHEITGRFESHEKTDKPHTAG
ncbi:MAG: pyridoxamine 5'-phosphate oxidase family protein [Mucilaginibacter sp.]